jgi:hypothetical protein
VSKIIRYGKVNVRKQKNIAEKKTSTTHDTTHERNTQKRPRTRRREAVHVVERIILPTLIKQNHQFFKVLFTTLTLIDRVNCQYEYGIRNDLTT